MSEREEEYRDKGLEILAVNAFEDLETGKEWIASSDLLYRWAFADEATTKAFGVNAVPTQILLDPEGQVVWTSDFSSIMGGADAVYEAIDAAM